MLQWIRQMSKTVGHNDCWAKELTNLQSSRILHSDKNGRNLWIEDTIVLISGTGCHGGVQIPCTAHLNRIVMKVNGWVILQEEDAAATSLMKCKEEYS